MRPHVSSGRARGSSEKTFLRTGVLSACYVSLVRKSCDPAAEGTDDDATRARIGDRRFSGPAPVSESTIGLGVCRLVGVVSD